MKIAILSNVNLDILKKQLEKTYDTFSTEGYGQWIKYALTKDERLNEFNPQCIFLLLDGFGIVENLEDEDKVKKELYSYTVFIKSLAENYPQATFAISNIHIKQRYINSGDYFKTDSPIEQHWDNLINVIMKEKKNVHLFKLRELIQTSGSVYDDKMWYMGSIPYSMKFTSMLEKEVSSFIEYMILKRKKVLITDLDNTLWGGVVGEDGPLGIEVGESHIGAIYRDGQKVMKQMKNAGILLAIVSKNNIEEVQEAFRTNKHMYLHEDDFSAIYCNWEPKVANIKQIAIELNLGLDSFVFLDDNNVEREAVRQQLPEVTVIDFPKDVSMLPKVLMETYNKYFFEWRITEEDLTRTRQYQEEVTRKKEMQKLASEDVSIDDYLKSLNIQIILSAVDNTNIERTVQLLNKTNQFNTNTVRMNMSEIQQYIADINHKVFVANVADKYGDNGLVSIIMINLDGSDAYVENFLMSCRVMGRQIEDAIISTVEKYMGDNGVKNIYSSYIPTAKNVPVRDLWERLGYNLVNECDGEKKYIKHLGETEIPALLKAEMRVV